MLAEQIRPLAAFAAGPLIVTLRWAAAPRPSPPSAGTAEPRGRLEELAAILRPLLAGERVTFRGRYCTVEGRR